MEMAGQAVLFLIISLCFRCLLLSSGGSGLRRGWGNCPDPPSGQPPAEGPCEPLYKKDAEPHFLSPFIAEASLKKRERKQEHRGWCRQPSAPLCPQIIHTSYLVSSNSDNQPHFTFLFCALSVNLIIRIDCYRQALWIVCFGLNYVATDQGEKFLIPRQDLKNPWKEAANGGISLLYFPKSKTCTTAFLARVVCL